MRNILFLIPGSGAGSSMIFVERQISLIEDEYVVHKLYIDAGKNLIKLIQNFLSVCRYLKSYQIDIVHSQYGSTTSLVGLLAALFFRKVYYCSFRGSDINEVFDKGLSISRLVAYICSMLSAIYAHRIQIVSEPMKKRLLFDFLTRKTEVIPSPVCDKTFVKLDKIECRKKLDLPLNKDLVAFYYNKDFLGKGGDLFNEVVSSYRTPDGKSLQPLFLKGITPDNMPLYLNAADILLFLSESEGSPNIVKEASLCGLPIITTRVGDIENYISESAGNYFVENYSDIKKALDCYFQNYRKRAESRQACIEIYANEIIKNRYKSFYQ